MWILMIVLLSTGQVENLEFSNVESCQHAHMFLSENVKGLESKCFFTKDKSVMEPKTPGKSNQL
jgi:hypothetical protein